MSAEPVYGRDAVLWRRTYDRVIVMVPGRDGFLTLQGTGCDLWAALHEPATLRRVAERLAAVYAAPADSVAADVAPILESLIEGGAVRRTCR